MAEPPASTASPKKPIYRIKLEDLCYEYSSSSKHLPPTSSIPTSQINSSLSPTHSRPRMSRFKEDLDSEVEERGIGKSKGKERADSAVDGLDEAADDAESGDSDIPNAKGEEALAWLDGALNLIKETSPSSKIDGIDGIHTQLCENRLSKKFKHGLMLMYTGLQTGTLPHAALLPHLFGQAVGSSGLVNAPFQAQPTPPNDIVEAPIREKLPLEIFIDYVKATVEGQHPLPPPKSQLSLLPIKQATSSSALPNGPLHTQSNPPNALLPTQTTTPSSSILGQQSAEMRWSLLPTPNLTAMNASLKAGMKQADELLAEDTVKTLLPNRRYRQIRNSRVKENARPYRKQSVAWAAFRIGRNIAGQSTHYDVLARHPFLNDKLLRDLWEDTRDMVAVTQSGYDEEVSERAERHAEYVTGLIRDDRRVERCERGRQDHVVARMGGCGRLVDMAWLGTRP